MTNTKYLRFVKELLAKARSINSKVNDSYGERELISIIQRGA